jgi:SAM-dependent methyltransferase
MSFEQGAFDVAVMFDVIEHLFDPRAVLEATRRALRPGGLLVVSTPNYDALSRHVLGESWAVLSPLEHLYYFNETTLMRMLGSTGFARTSMVRTGVIRSPVETMNYHYTHAPGTLRTRLYAMAVHGLGGVAAGWVQRAGRADALVCVAGVD